MNNIISQKIISLVDFWDYIGQEEKIRLETGFYIGATVFEPGITIYHHGTIIINGNAAIGQGCCLHGNNCIGNDGKSGGAPVIGKNVDIGFGAVIIGDIQIADNCKIGAGAVVVHSCLEEGSTLVGVPARRV